MGFKDFQLKSKMEGFQRAKRKHVCLDCCYHQEKTFAACPECGSKNRQFFMSDTEHKRGVMLLMMQRAGTISRLRFQPKYDLKVNGQLVGTYIADCEYLENGVMVTEDSKPEAFMDKTSLLKIKLFEAIYGLTVKIPQRKSGNRAKTKKVKTLLDKPKKESEAN